MRKKKDEIEMKKTLCEGCGREVEAHILDKFPLCESCDTEDHIEPEKKVKRRVTIMMKKKAPNNRTVFYPVDVQDWGDGKPEIVEYLRSTPFDNATDCCTFCRRKEIKHYTIEEQVKERVLFDDDIDWMWKSTSVIIKEV